MYVYEFHFTLNYHSSCTLGAAAVHDLNYELYERDRKIIELIDLYLFSIFIYNYIIRFIDIDIL